MLNLGQIVAHLGLDAGGFHKGLADVETALGGLGKLLLGFAGAASAAAGFTTKLASDVTETQSLAVNAFGKEGSAALEKWAATAGEAMGRTTQQMRLYATGIQAVLAPTQGMTEQTARMSKTLAQLAVDLGSAFNTSDAEAFNALKSGISGETEPLKKLGIVMTDHVLQQYAMSKGIYESVETMREAKKELLRYNYIIQASKIAHNDAAETAGSFANQLKAVESGVLELATRVGQALLPQTQALTDHVLHLINYLRSLDPETIKMAASLASSAVQAAALAGGALLLTQGLLDMGRAVIVLSQSGTGLVAFFGKLLTAFALPLGAALLLAGAIAAIVSTVLVLRGTWGDLQRELSEGWSDVAGAIRENIGGALKWLFETMKGLLQGMFDAPLRAISALIDAFATLAEKVTNSRIGKALGISIDPQTLAQMRETAKMMGEEHVDVLGSMAISWNAISEVGKEAAGNTVEAWKKGAAALTGDMKALLQNVLPSGVMAKINEILEGFSKQWDKADPAKKRAGGVGALGSEEAMDMGASFKVDMSAQQVSMAFFGMIPSVYALQQSIVGLYKQQQDEIAQRRVFLETQGKELQNGTDVATKFAVALRGSQEALKGGDWANMLAGELAAGLSGGLSNVNWAKVITGGSVGGLEKYGQEAIGQVANVASKVFDSGDVEKVAGMASSAVEKIAGMGAATLGVFASFASGLADTVLGAITEGMKFVGDAVKSALDNTVGFVGSNMIADPRIQAATGAGVAAFTSLTLVIGIATAALAALPDIILGFSLVLGLLNPVLGITVAVFSSLIIAGIVATGGLLLFGAALTGVMIGIFALATKSQSYERFQHGVERVVDRLVQATEPLFQQLMPLVGLSYEVAVAWSQLIQAVIPGQLVARGLFDVFQQLAAGAINVSVALLNLRIFLIEVAIQFLQFGNSLATAGATFEVLMATMRVKLMDALDTLPGVGFSDDQWSEARGAIDTAVTNMANAGNTFGGAISSLQQQLGTAVSDRDVAMTARDAVLGATYDQMMAFANSLTDATDATNKATESLTNVPSGYKVALARFNNTRDTSGGFGQDSERSGGGLGADMLNGGMMSPGMGTAIYVENLIIQGAQSAEDMGNKILGQAKRRNFIQTGSSNVRPTRPFIGG